MGALISSGKEEYALGMAQRPNDAAVRDVQIKSFVEVFASSTGRRSDYAVKKVAQIMLRVGECARGMERRRNANYAAVMDVPIKFTDEEFASNMVAMLVMTHPQLLELDHQYFSN